MKFAIPFFVFIGLVGVALAGAPPQEEAAVGCHGQVAQVGCHGVREDAGCHGQTLLVPAVTAAAACHGGQRVTLAERRTARRASRANKAATRAAFLDAARYGDVQPVAVEMP